MTLRQKLLGLGLGALALLLSFAAGRFAAPTRVETRVEFKDRTVTQWRTQVVEKVVQGPVRVETRTVERTGSPGCGPVREVVKVEVRGAVETTVGTVASGEQQKDQQGRQEKVETRSAPRLFLAVQAGAPLNNLGQVLSKPDVLGTAAYRFAGPLNVVLSVGRVQSDVRVMAGLGVSF